jgi:hypothetical protein
MAQQALVLQSVGANSSVWAHPDDIAYTVREMRKITPKSVGSSVLQNVRSEVINNYTVTVPDCDGVHSCANGTEVLSVRTSISGSHRNAAELARMVTDHIAQLQAFMANNFHKGYTPQGVAITADIAPLP